MTASQVDRRPRRRNGGWRTTRMSPKNKRSKRRSLLARDGNQCHWCKQEFSEELPPTFDHLLALKDGGYDTADNMVLACFPCNNGRANDPEW